MIDHEKYAAAIAHKELETRLIRVDADNIAQKDLQLTAEALRAGELVAFPTETVYGLGANALDAAAVSHVFAAKGRPADNPLIVHISSIDDLEQLVTGIPRLGQNLFAAFAPGPLTLVFRRKPAVPDIVTAGLDTVAVRIPAHPVARELIRLAKVPVAAPSANRSGRPSPTRAWHVRQDLWGRVSYIIDGGMCTYGLESTVLDLSSATPVLLRPGTITARQLSEVAGRGIINADSGTEPKRDAVQDIELQPRSPGVKYRHYAPKAKLLIAADARPASKHSQFAQYLAQMKTENLKIGIFCSQEILQALGEKYYFIRLPAVGGNSVKGSIYAFVYGEKSDPDAAGAALFDAMRQLDKAGVDVIIAEGMPEGDNTAAYMNRLDKAAANEQKHPGGQRP